MKLKITDSIAVGYEPDDYLLINQEGDVAAVSGNSDFDDLGVEISPGEYLVVQVLSPEEDEDQLGCTLDIIGCQWHHSPGEVQEYVLGDMPTSKAV